MLDRLVLGVLPLILADSIFMGVWNSDFIGCIISVSNAAVTLKDTMVGDKSATQLSTSLCFTGREGLFLDGTMAGLVDLRNRAGDFLAFVDAL